jgi:LEA14-like dessication related protein
MAGFRSLFFGSTLRTLLTVLLVLGATVGGAYAVGILGAPSVKAVENRFGEVTAETTEIGTDLVVHNPNPIGVRLGGASVNYTVAMNEVPLASGGREGLRMETGNTTLEFTTEMDNEQIPKWWVTHVRRGERTTVAIDATVESSLLGRSLDVPFEEEISTDIVGQFNSTETRPVNADKPLLADPVLYINETSANWGSVTDRETPIDIRFKAYNPKKAPYTITEIGYDITMNDVDVGTGASERTYTIPSRSTETIETTTAIENPALDEWWVSHLERNQVTDLRIDFYARIELIDGQTIRIPLDALTYEKEIETDVFGTKPETDASSDTPATPTASGGDGADGDSPADGSIVDTPQTVTPTDDSGLLGDGTSTPDGDQTPTPDGGSTPEDDPTPEGDSTPTPTPTPDDGLL